MIVTRYEYQIVCMIQRSVENRKKTMDIVYNKKIETVLNSNKMGGYHDKRWTGLSEKMFDWTNDFPDVKCTDPNCTKIHPEDNEYYVPE